MRWGVAFSAALHVSLALLVYFGVPALFAPELAIEQPIPVDIITVAEVTTPPPLETVEEAVVEPEPEPVVEVEPVQESAPIPPPPETVAAPPPAEKAVKAPLPLPSPPAREKPAKKPVPPPPKPIKVAKAEPPPAPRPKPKPKPKFDSLLVNLAAVSARPRTDPKAEEKDHSHGEPAPVAASVATAVSPRAAPLSLSVVDAIRRQVEENWNVPVGAREARELTVEIHIVLLPDGTVRAAEIADKARLKRSGEEFFRAMAESAVRAVWRASPLQNLPPGKFDQWREITFTFRPPA